MFLKYVVPKDVKLNYTLDIYSFQEIISKKFFSRIYAGPVKIYIARVAIHHAVIGRKYHQDHRHIVRVPSLQVFPVILNAVTVRTFRFVVVLVVAPKS